MKSIGSAFALLVLFVLPIVSLPTTVLADNSLDGKAFTVTVDGKQDVLTFANGTFHSASCDEYGFGKGDYRTTPSGDGITFEAKTTSPNTGEITWKGTVRGDVIEGNYHWTKKGWFWDRSKSMDFKGMSRN